MKFKEIKVQVYDCLYLIPSDRQEGEKLYEFLRENGIIYLSGQQFEDPVIIERIYRGLIEEFVEESGIFFIDLDKQRRFDDIIDKLNEKYFNKYGYKIMPAISMRLSGQRGENGEVELEDIDVIERTHPELTVQDQADIIRYLQRCKINVI